MSGAGTQGDIGWLGRAWGQAGHPCHIQHLLSSLGLTAFTPFPSLIIEGVVTSPGEGGSPAQGLLVPSCGPPWPWPQVQNTAVLAHPPTPHEGPVGAGVLDLQL